MIWHASGPGTVSASRLPAGHPGQPQHHLRRAHGARRNGHRATSTSGRRRPTGAFDMAAGKAVQPATYYFGCTGRSDLEAPHKVDCNWPGHEPQDRDLTPRASPRCRPPTSSASTSRPATATSPGSSGATLTITDRGINLLEPQGYSLDVMTRSETTRADRGRHDLEFGLRAPAPRCSSPSAPSRWAWPGWPTTGWRARPPPRLAFGASSGSLPEADESILLSLKSSLPAEELARSIGSSCSSRATPTARCQPAASRRSGATSQIGVSTGATPTPGPRCGRSPTARPRWTLGSADDFWAPTSARTPSPAPRLHRGVAAHRPRGQTGTFWTDFTITKASIYRIQPDING